MKIIDVLGEQVPVYDYNDFPYNDFSNTSTVELGKKRYANLICSFDIETTTMYKEEQKIFDRDFGFMYVWQFAIEHTVCMGRTWEEWLEFLLKLEEHIGLTDRRLVIWVHNLSFEFQFFRNFLKIDQIFARNKRKV